jgi:hypothetical protein
MTASGFHNDERGSPSGPDARQQDPEAPVRLREPDSPRSCALQHVKLVPQGQDFEVECRRDRDKVRRVSRSGRSTEIMAEKNYPLQPATSTAATRSDFLVRTPVHCQKRLRLQEARHLLHGASAASAIALVGYESASHFNREYRRLFGTPRQRNVRSALTA